MQTAIHRSLVQIRFEGVTFFILDFSSPIYIAIGQVKSFIGLNEILFVLSVILNINVKVQ